MTNPRGQSATATLARYGFTDPARAETDLASGEMYRVVADDEASRDAILTALSSTADPDAALAGLVRLLSAAAGDSDLTAALVHDNELRHRLLAVLGASAALADHLARHPHQWRALRPEFDVRPTAFGLRCELLRAVGAAEDEPAPCARLAGGAALNALRVAYRRCLLQLTARDLTGVVQVDDVAAELADLAAATLEAALAVARAELPAAAAPTRLAVVAMGKCGGRELNYVSDVDVVFVAESADGADEVAALRSATLLATAMMRVCAASTAEGTIWPVDAALRPEGKAGPLVRTLASHVAYYERWAKTWEFQALLKARPVAGDRELGSAYVEAISPLVWRAAAREEFVNDVQQMRRRVEATLPADQSQRQIKLGPGGLRDVEFSVQLLQLVHGRTDETLRSGSTLVALDALARGGYVGRADARTLTDAYCFLRAVEHRLQLHRLRRTHVMPDDERELRRLGRSIGLRADPVNELHTQWRQHAREVRRLHEKLFYRPLLASVARLGPEEARLTPEAAGARLQALGYSDPAGALRHLEALTSGMSRRAAIQRTLLPVMLAWFADAPDPDGGLLAFRQVSDALGTTPWYLRLLRDEGKVAERLARLLAGSRYLVELLQRAPDSVAMLADDADLVPRSRPVLANEMTAALRRYDDAEQAVAAIRGVRRRELFRVATADLLGLIDIDALGGALTDVTAATLQAALDVAVRAVEARRGSPMPTRLAVIALGRLGGREMGYASDADVLFVHDPHEDVDEREAGEAAHAVANDMRRLLGVPGPDPALIVDPDLRPEGRQGPLVRTVASYGAYYARWSKIWESQALLRAEGVAGDRRVAAQFIALIDPLRYPAEGLAPADVREVRRIKARVDAERLPRGADPARHTKLGPGALADIEWTLQLLQLRHAGAIAGLRTTRTLTAVRAAETAGLLSGGQAATLSHAWRTASRARNAILLARGRSGDSLPSDMRELAGIARILGYPPGSAGSMLEDYRRATRRARTVVDEVFFR